MKRIAKSIVFYDPSRIANYLALIRTLNLTFTKAKQIHDASVKNKFEEFEITSVLSTDEIIENLAKFNIKITILTFKSK